ncbi:hypothetical protein N431DRAFT_490334 [Stipitochalara longipes BDJ]|nr:hypothetical protein N431DRAFT_490334 [Stipitochalara longipes BDJ]
MQFSTLTLVAFATSMTSSLVSATVFVGLRTGSDGSQSKVAWTNGTPDICADFATIIAGNSDFCGPSVFVDGNNGPFTWQNCGVGNPVLFRNGQFNAVCSFVSKNIACPGGVNIGQQWQC